MAVEKRPGSEGNYREVSFNDVLAKKGGAREGS